MAQPNSPDDRFVAAEDVAESLGLTIDQVVDLIHEGHLRAIALGAPPRWRVAVASVEVFLDDRSETARRTALWRQSQAASFPELWGRGDIRHGD